VLARDLGAARIAVDRTLYNTTAAAWVVECFNQSLCKRTFWLSFRVEESKCNGVVKWFHFEFGRRVLRGLMRRSVR
jgi:hypothetical protein